MEDKQNKEINRNFSSNSYQRRREQIMEQYRRAFENRPKGAEELVLSGVVPPNLRHRLP